MIVQNSLHQASLLFYELIKRGHIDRYASPDLWAMYKDQEVKDCLDTIIDANCCELINVTERVYIIPRLENEVFLKTNVDFRKDISADSDARLLDLDLMKYITIYLSYIFFNGKGIDPASRDFISKEEFLKEFNNHMGRFLNETPDFSWSDHASYFVKLANYWLNKPEGDRESRKFNERYGMINRLLIKLNNTHDDLFFEEGGNIRPSRKMKDIIPELLRKERIIELNYIIIIYGYETAI